MNHADDRLRGMSTNPFKLKAQAVIFNANGKEKGNGPFPGDDILYAFKLFADAKRTQPTGTAMFTCYYGFGKRATCDSYFDLAKGLLLASGQVPFGKTHFALGVTGGTHGYWAALETGGLRAGCQERTAVRPQVTGSDMTGASARMSRDDSRRLGRSLCRHRATVAVPDDTTATTTAPVTPVLGSFRRLRQADASEVRRPSGRPGARGHHQSVRVRPNVQHRERQLRGKKGGEAAENALFTPQAVLRRQAHATRRHRGVLLHGQLRPASDLRGPVRAQRRDHDRDGPSGSQER